MTDVGKTALDLLKELEEEKKKAEELKVKTKELEVILIDYRETLRRYDCYAFNFDYVLYFRKDNELYSEKLEKIIEALERMRPVKVKVKVKVDTLLDADLQEFEDITGDVIDVVEYEIIEDILRAPIFNGKGILGGTTSVKIRTDSRVIVVKDGTRNYERAKVLAQKGVEVLYGIGKTIRTEGYTLVEGIYVIPLETVRKMMEEREEKEEEKELQEGEKIGKFKVEEEQ